MYAYICIFIHIYGEREMTNWALFIILSSFFLYPGLKEGRSSDVGSLPSGQGHQIFCRCHMSPKKCIFGPPVADGVGRQPA